MAGVTIIDQATRQIGLGLAYAEAARAAFWEKFGLRLEVDPGFVDDYNYCVRDGLGNVADLALPHVKWVEGFREGWLRYQAALVDWQKEKMSYDRQNNHKAKERGRSSWRD